MQVVWLLIPMLIFISLPALSHQGGSYICEGTSTTIIKPDGSVLGGDKPRGFVLHHNADHLLLEFADYPPSRLKKNGWNNLNDVTQFDGYDMKNFWVSGQNELTFFFTSNTLHSSITKTGKCKKLS